MLSNILLNDSWIQEKKSHIENNKYFKVYNNEIQTYQKLVGCDQSGIQRKINSFYEKINGLEDSTLLRGQSFSNWSL